MSHMIKKFIDMFGVIWELRKSNGENYVWNELLGVGVWDNGRGLTEWGL